MEDLPLITVCTLTLNRAWIIDLMLKSLLSQDYPRSKMYFVLIDGSSTDNTVKIAEQILKSSGIRYKIIVKKSNIGKARNICIDEVEGELLVFWDSDVIAPSSALRELVKAVRELGLDIVAIKRVYMSFDDVLEARSFTLKFFENSKGEQKKPPHSRDASHIQLIHFAGMDLTGIKRHVIEDIRFKPMPFSEDAEFCLRALKRGYSIAMLSSTEVYDIKVRKIKHSDPFVYASFWDTLKFLATLAHLETLRNGPEGRFLKNTCSLNDIITFYIERKHYVIKLGFLVALALFFIGLILKNVFLLFLLPLSWISYLIMWITRLGVHGGIRRAINVFIVNIPLSLIVAYYLFNNYLRCKYLMLRHR